MARPRELKLKFGADGVSILELDRPAKRNALTAAMLEAIGPALERARERGARALIVRGAGEHFCAGGDVEGFAELADDDARRAQMHRSYEAFLELERFPAPVIAAVDGIAYGGGTELALASDLVIATTRARFRLPEAGVGLLAGYGVDRADRALGRGAAAWLALAPEPVGAERALAIGLVQELVGPERLETASLRLAQAIAALPEPAVTALKCYLREPAHERLDRAVEFNVELFGTPEHAAAVAEFTRRATKSPRG